MMTNPIDELSELKPNPAIEWIVSNRNLKAVITSSKGDYEFQIYTERAAKDADQEGLRRTYALIEITGESKMVENWGRRDENAMVRIFSNLLRFSDYEITQVVSDWKVTCGECGHVEQGRHYEPQPRACKSAKSSGCSLRAGKGFTGKARITDVEEYFD